MEYDFKRDYPFSTKDEMLKKLRAFSINPDDDTCWIKYRIKNILLHTPEILYALNNKEFESELFNENGELNVDENGEPLGEWDLYFGDGSNIRPYLFFPDTQTESKNYIAYQVQFTESPNAFDRIKSHRKVVTEKLCQVVFHIFVYHADGVDKLTGIPRHDLIAAMIRERFAWSGFTMSSAIPVSDKESSTDNNYITRTLIFEANIPNSLVETDLNGVTSFTNKGKI